MPRIPRLDIEVLLDCVFDHKLEHIRDYLAHRSLKKSGNAEDLRARLRQLLASRPSEASSLTEHLNRIDGWGDQYLYLYKSPVATTKRWRDEKFVNGTLQASGAIGLLNSHRSVLLPSEPTIATIDWSATGVRFVWNETRVWYERRPERDYESNDNALLYRASERKAARGTLAFDWDLRTGSAMVMIQRLPSGTRYHVERDNIIDLLKPFVDVGSFAALRVSRSIKKLLRSGEVRERKTNWETIRGGKAAFTSAGKQLGVRSDSTLRAMEDAALGRLQGSLGNMYWIPTKPDLSDELHTVIHRKDQRIGIMGEKTEQEVRYVIGRIRAHCS